MMMEKLPVTRDERQDMIEDWIVRVWTDDSMNPRERMERLIEEVFELAQIEGISKERIDTIHTRVNEKPPGIIAQEVGGISVTLLGYCQSRGISADTCEDAEIQRVLAKPVEHFRARHAKKVASGLAVAL